MCRCNFEDKLLYCVFLYYGMAFLQEVKASGGVYDKVCSIPVKIRYVS